MAVSRTQRQPCGDHPRRLATLLNRCSSALPRRASNQRCYAHPNRSLPCLGSHVAEHRSSKHQLSTASSKQRSARSDSPDASVPTGAELAAAIRTCSSQTQLVNLYQLHGPRFTAAHAYVALNRLVDVTLGPDPDENGAELDVGDTERDGGPAGAQSGAPHHHTPHLTGRLRVQQGQEFAQPPLHAEAETASAALAAPPQRQVWKQQPDEERRESNYAASTSEPLARKRLTPHRGKRRAAQPQAVRQAPHELPRQEQQPQEEQVTPGIDGLTQQQPSDATASHAVIGAASAAGTAPLPPSPPPPRRVIVSMVTGLAAVLARACHGLDGRGVAETARALSRLRYQDPSLLRRLEHRSVQLMKHQGTASAGRATAAGDTGPRSGTGRQRRGGDAAASDGSSSTSASSSSSSSAAAPEAPAVDRRQQQGQQPRRRGQGAQAGTSTGIGADNLFTMVIAFGAMGHRPSDAWRTAAVKATRAHLPAYAASPRGRLALLLSSLGDFGATPPSDWLRAACAAAQPRLATCPPPQLRALAAGLAAMKHHPGDAWMAEYLAACERRMEQYSAWELVSTVGSLAALRCSPGDSWMERFYACTAALVGTAGGMTGRLAALLLSSMSQLNCRPAGDWLTLLLLGTRRSLGDATAEELAGVLSALARLRFRPPEPWLQQYFTASFQRLPFQTPEQCCAAAVALSALGRRPQPLWLEELGRHMGRQLALMPAGRQAMALAALVELGYRPSGRWLEAYEKQSNGRLAETGPEELCQALVALAKVGFKPQASWLYAFILAVYSKLDSFDSAQLALVFDRLPALTPHGAWLDEIIQICAAEAAMKAQLTQVASKQQQQQREAVPLQRLHEQALKKPAQRGQQQVAQPGHGASPVVHGVEASTAGPKVAETEIATVVEVEQAATTTASPRSAAAAAGNSQDGLVLAGLEAEAAAVEPGTLDLLTTATGDQSGGAVPAVQDVTDWAAAAALAEAKDAVPPAALNGTISIASELVPSAGDVLSVAAPCGRVPHGPLFSGTVSMGTGSDFDCAAIAADGSSTTPATAGELLQRIPQEDLLVVESSSAAAAALVVLTQKGGGNISSSTNSNDDEASAVTPNGSANGARVASRSRGRGDGPGGGGGGDGDGPGGRSGGGTGSQRWDDELLTDVGAAAGPGINDNGRTPDVGLLQRPRVGRAPAATVLVSSSSAVAGTPGASAALPPWLPRPQDPAWAPAATTAAMDPAASPPASAVAGNTELDLSSCARAEPAAVTAAAAAASPVITLQPKPRPPGTATGSSAVAGPPTATRSAASEALAASPAAASVQSVLAVGAGAGTAEASRPLLPFGSPAQEAPAGAAAASMSAASADAAVDTAVADISCVQYLDSASLSRLIGTPDGPPGPDFSGCQKRAMQGRVARGSRSGPFQLGKVWNNDGGGTGGGALAPIPVPSPSG